MNRRTLMSAVAIIAVAAFIAVIPTSHNSASGAESGGSDITSVALGDIYDYQSFAPHTEGDTFNSAWSANGNSYVVSDDGTGFNSGGLYVHGRLSELGGNPNVSTNGYQGQNLDPGTLSSNMPNQYTNSIYELNGVLYAVQFQEAGDYTSNVFQYPTIIKSSDGGANWFNYLGAENAAPPFDAAHTMFPSTNDKWGWPTFFQYGQGGSSPPADNSQTYEYLVSYDTSATGTSNPWRGVLGDKVYLARVAKALLPDLNASDIEYYTGGDGMSGSNWSSNADDSASILTDDSNQDSNTVSYDYGLKRYVMESYSDYFPDSTIADGKARFETYTSQYPWGPWTKNLNYGIWGMTASQDLASNEYTSADGKKMWSQFSGGFNGSVWPYGFMYNPTYFSTGTVDIYQAENATLSGVSSATTYPSYQGSGYVSGFNATGDGATFTINNVSGTGWHIVNLRYSDPTNAQTLSIAVNGQKVRQVHKFSQANNDYNASQDWADYSQIYYLQNGTNTFKVYQDGGDNGSGLNLDSISVAENATYDEGKNVALSATATASSTYSGYSAAAVNDGIAEGYPDNTAYEWASNGGGVGAWSQLTWSSTQNTDKVVLYDRPNLTDQVTSGTLTFSDGSSVSVGALQDDGQAGDVITFPTKQITWARFTVNSDKSGTQNIGLGDFQVFTPNGDEPTGYWPLDETSGSIAPDMSGFGQTGSASNTSWVTGHEGNALSFNGSTSQVELPVASNPTSFTASIWVKPAAISSENVFVQSNSSGPTAAWSQEIRINSSGKAEAYVANASAGAETVTGTTTLTAGNWYHLVMTVANGGQLHLYVNGTEEGTPQSVTAMWAAGDRYYLGAATAGSFGYAAISDFDGIIDGAKLFDSQLTSTQVAALP
jgi:hypothetical protein